MISKDQTPRNQRGNQHFCILLFFSEPTKMAFPFPIPCLILLSAAHCCSAGPVNVRIETENTQDFHIGPEPRTRFDLVEEYKPLSQAVHTKHARALSSSLSKQRESHRPQPVHVLVDIGELDPASAGKGRAVGEKQQRIVADREQSGGGGPRTLTRSQWLEWTRWSRCENGERVRVRKCLTIGGVPCEGPGVEKQNCFSPLTSNIKFAKDPTIIEREIRREVNGSGRH